MSIETGTKSSIFNVTELILFICLLPPSYVLFQTIFNVYFHQLSKFPGPKLFAATRIPFTYYSLTGKLPFVVKELHDKYGPVVRISPNDLAFVSAQAWRDIYGAHPSRPAYPKDPSSYGANTRLPDSIFLANDELHTRLRRQLAYAFSTKAVQEQEPLINRHVDGLLEKLRTKCAEGPQDMMAWYNWTTFDIIGDLALGEPFGCLENTRWHFFVLNILQAIRAGAVAIHLNHYGAMSIAMRFVPKSFIEKQAMNREYVKTNVDKRLEMGSSRPDFMSFMMRESKGHDMLSRPQMYSNMYFLIIAGSETTASLLSGVTFQLLRNPGKFKKLVQEIRSSFSSDDSKQLNFNSLSELPYLRACLDEGLRMYPPVAAGLGRIVVGEGEAIDGHVVPAGTSVSVFQWACSRSDLNWSKPNEYLPERWLSADGDKASVDTFGADKKDSSQPFSLGPRNCLGKHLATVEMRIILARLLWNYDLTIVDDTDDWMNQRVFVIWEKLPLMVNLTPVKR